MFAMLIGYAMLSLYLGKLFWIMAHLQMILAGFDSDYEWDGVIPSKDYLVIGVILLLGGVIFG